MKPEKDKIYNVTLLDGKVEKLRFVKEAPGNVLQFETMKGDAFSVPTGGFTNITEFSKEKK